MPANQLTVKLEGVIGKISVVPPKLNEDNNEVKNEGKIIVPLEVELTDYTRTKLVDLSRLASGKVIDCDLTDPQFQLGLKEGKQAKMQVS